HAQRRGAERGRGVAFGVVARLHVLAQAQFLGPVADPAGAGADLPGIAALAGRGHQEQRGGDLHLAGAGAAGQDGGAQREGLAALLVEGDQLEVMQHVVGPVAGGGARFGCRRCVIGEQQPGAAGRGGKQDQGGWNAPVHAVPSARTPAGRTRSASRPSTWPWASSSRSQNSRTAPAPPPARLRQCTRSATQGWASAGAADGPTCAMMRRSGRSSPMKDTWSIDRPSRAAMSRTVASLSGTAVWTSRMRSSAARCSTTVLERAVTKATSM